MNLLVLLLCLIHSIILYSIVPVLLIPDYAASIPKGDVNYFAINRGINPKDLKLSTAYYTLIEGLELIGYKANTNLFHGVYDWRLLTAPIHAKDHKSLFKVNSSFIINDHYDYAIKYLGYWLKQIVKNNPNEKYIDVIAHGFGGILARCYIQSPAYGAEIIINQKRYKLPKIRKLILAAVPNEGSIFGYDNYSKEFKKTLDKNRLDSAFGFEEKVSTIAYNHILNNNKISGIDYNISIENISQDRSDNSRLKQFSRLYNRMKRDLSPSSKLISVLNEDRYWTDIVNDKKDNSILNTYSIGAKEVSSIWDYVIPGLLNKNDYIETHNIDECIAKNNIITKVIGAIDIFSDSDDIFSKRFIKRSFIGDGYSSKSSYKKIFPNNSKVKTVEWGNDFPECVLAEDQTWQKTTNYPLNHDMMFFNSDVVDYIIHYISGKESNISEIYSEEIERWIIKLEELDDLKTY